MNEHQKNAAVDVSEFNWSTFDDLHGRFRRHTEALDNAMRTWPGEVPESTAEVILNSLESTVKEMGEVVEAERTRGKHRGSIPAPNEGDNNKWPDFSCDLPRLICELFSISDLLMMAAERDAGTTIIGNETVEGVSCLISCIAVELRDIGEALYPDSLDAKNEKFDRFKERLFVKNDL